MAGSDNGEAAGNDQNNSTGY
ncbi:Protein of unknown function [Lactobacillus delbrueckii subsp. lactis]|nr:Protein of unknown function [Lactobacillus delbrueckii subsp. lactis]CDR83476.1 Protein of unknown function [Lactobacillus delbrueckii subsp. lactis]